MTDRPRRLLLQRTGPAFGHGPATTEGRIRAQGYAIIERRILIEANNLLADHIPHLSAAVRCALRQALERQT